MELPLVDRKDRPSLWGLRYGGSEISRYAENWGRVNALPYVIETLKARNGGRQVEEKR